MPMYKKHARVTLKTAGKGRTKQAHKAECDINTIMAKYRQRGILPHANRYKGQYMDLPNSTDYEDNLKSIIDAQMAFDSLPSAIRTKFSNNPKEFLEFVQNPENQAEINKLGLGVEPIFTDPEPATPADPPAQPEG